MATDARRGSEGINLDDILDGPHLTVLGVKDQTYQRYINEQFQLIMQSIGALEKATGIEISATQRDTLSAAHLTGAAIASNRRRKNGKEYEFSHWSGTGINTANAYARGIAANQLRYEIIPDELSSSQFREDYFSQAILATSTGLLHDAAEELMKYEDLNRGQAVKKVLDIYRLSPGINAPAQAQLAYGLAALTRNGEHYFEYVDNLLTVPEDYRWVWTVKLADNEQKLSSMEGFSLDARLFNSLAKNFYLLRCIRQDYLSTASDMKSVPLKTYTLPIVTAYLDLAEASAHESSELLRAIDTDMNNLRSNQSVKLELRDTGIESIFQFKDADAYRFYMRRIFSNVQRGLESYAIAGNLSLAYPLVEQSERVGSVSSFMSKEHPSPEDAYPLFNGLIARTVRYVETTKLMIPEPQLPTAKGKTPRVLINALDRTQLYADASQFRRIFFRLADINTPYTLTFNWHDFAPR